MIEEVEEFDGKLFCVEVFGESYVVFCDIKGCFGLFDEFCLYCKVLLVYGWNEECGLWCLYYGWKMDVDGNVVVMFFEFEGSFFMDKVKYCFYFVKEWGGFVWVWLGDKEDMFEF